MALIKHTLLPLRRLQEEINQLFDQGDNQFDGDYSRIAASEWQPRVDVKEETDKFIIKADIPGVEPKDIEVSMQDGALIIQGERQSESKTEKDGFVRIERASGKFYRRFNLSDAVDEENIKAAGKHGVLEIIIPKSAKKLPKRINVEIAE